MCSRPSGERPSFRWRRARRLLLLGALCLVTAMERLEVDLATAVAALTPPPAAPGSLRRLRSSATAAEVAAVLRTDGVVVIEGRTTPEKMKEALAELENGRMSNGQNVRFGHSTQLLKNPLDPAAEPVLTVLANDPVILQAAEALRPLHGQGAHSCIGWEVRLLILGPGFPEGSLHRDVVDSTPIPLERPLQWGLNAIWAVDGFTSENGATRFVPGSHSAAEPQGSWVGDNPEAEARAVAATMPAGSVVVYYASLLHGSGENRSPDSRTGLNFNYAFIDEHGQRPAGWGY